MTRNSCSYKRHRFPAEIIARAVWLYYRYPLSLRLVEEMLLERGIVVSYETIRQRCTKGGHKFGPEYARRLRRKQSGSSDVWHLGDSAAQQGFAEQKSEWVVISINGKKHWLWRAVDQDGYVLDKIVQTRRNTKSAKRLLKRLAKKQRLAPKRMITDKLGSYGAAKRQIVSGVEHRSRITALGG